jgi:hypothetical protein
MKRSDRFVSWAAVVALAAMTAASVVMLCTKLWGLP